MKERPGINIWKFDKQSKTNTKKTQSFNYSVYINSPRRFYNNDMICSDSNLLTMRFNIETELFEFVNVIGSGISSVFFFNETIGYNTSSRTIYKFNSSEHKTYISNTINNLRGVNWNGTKAFVNGNVYQLNPDLSLGNLLKSNAYSLSSDVFIFTANDKYYIIDKKIYTFNESTNEFSLFDSTGDYYMSDYGTIVKYISSSDKIYFYSFNNTDTQIGFRYNGTSYFYGTFNVLDTNKILINNSIIDASGNIIVGTMPNNGELNYTPSTSQQTIPAGYTSGGTIEAVTMSEEDIENAIAQAEDILD